MTTEAQQTTPAQNTSQLPASEASTDVEGDLDQRADAIISKLNADAKSDARAETEQAEPKAPKEVEAAKPAATKPDKQTEKTPEQIATDRRERLAAIDKMAEEERAKVAAKRARPAEQPAPPQVAQQPAAPPFDPKDPASVFRYVESLGVPPAAVADWLASANDPARVAEHAAKKSLSPVEAKLQELAEQQRRLEHAIATRDQQLYEQRIADENRQVLVSRLESVKSESPLAARLYAKSPHKFMAAVDNVCDRLPDGFTAQDVIDQIEESLSDLQLTEVTPAKPGTDSTNRKGPAAAKANVGNRLAAERGSVVDDEGDEPSDLEERARRLKARLAAAG